MNIEDGSRRKFRPQTQLIEMIPGFQTRRLSEIELGRLVLLGNYRDTMATAGIAIRADALSRAGDITEGVVRLGGGRVRFERHELDQDVIAVDIEYLLEPDLASAAVRAPVAGNLIVPTAGRAAGVLVAGPWQGLGLLDIASAVARPFADSSTHNLHVSLAWQLVDREERRRILFIRHASEGRSDDLPRYARERQGEEVRRYTSDLDD
jgi:hypothetical protein